MASCYVTLPPVFSLNVSRRVSKFVFFFLLLHEGKRPSPINSSQNINVYPIGSWGHTREWHFVFCFFFFSWFFGFVSWLFAFIFLFELCFFFFLCFEIFVFSGVIYLMGSLAMSIAITLLTVVSDGFLLCYIVARLFSHR